MNKALEIFLGILAAMGGFVEIGELTFAVNAGSKFGFRIMWVVLLGTVGIISYGEMSGRIAAVTKKPVFVLIRDRIGWRAGLVTLVAANVVNLLTLTAEIGGIAMVLKLLFGANYFLMIVASTAVFIFVIWIFQLKWLERIFGLLGLAMIVYLAAAISSGPDWSHVAAGFIPNIPQAETTGDYFVYAYMCVALMSSIMLPYETYFYASGAIEDRWTDEDIKLNRLISVIGFSLGALLCIALVILGAQVFSGQQIEPQLPGTAALGPAMFYGKIGLLLALLGMFFAFGGAAVEVALSGAYNLCHFMDWPWGKSKRPTSVPVFTEAWVGMFILAMIIILTGVDPVQVVEYSIIFAVVILPLTYWPVLRSGNDKQLMDKHVNGWLARSLGWLFFILITVAALSAIPLLMITNGGKG